MNDPRKHQVATIRLKVTGQDDLEQNIARLNTLTDKINKVLGEFEELFEKMANTELTIEVDESPTPWEVDVKATHDTLAELLESKGSK